MSATVEQRIAALEKRLTALQQGPWPDPSSRAWLDDLYGKFADDPVFERAMKLGRKYRQSLQPRVRKAGPKK